MVNSEWFWIVFGHKPIHFHHSPFTIHHSPFTIHHSLYPRSADRHLVHPEVRLADADRHALAGLAAHADAGVELHVVADHGDAVHGVGAVADQHGALDRLRHLAVLDHVGLGAAEHEFARGDIDLAAAEGDGVDAVLDGGD